MTDIAKKGTVRILVLVLSITVLLTLLPAITYANPTYNATAAVNYAVAHWNDGVGICDEFVKACLSAGGINITANTVTYVHNALLKETLNNTSDIQIPVS